MKPMYNVRILTTMLLACFCVVSVIATETSVPWVVEVLSAEVAEGLSSVQSYVQYGGDMEEVEYNNAPKEGHIYLLVQLSISKEQAGRSLFFWDELRVQDGEGNEYARHENDTFLEAHNYDRIKSTDLTFGQNEGFACFEIPKEAIEGDLWLVYLPMNGDDVKIQIKVEVEEMV